ncbi:hypothetical protein A0H76_2756 [Hepatospora eriocheir]|uniref:Uncharacterized protein n=1 Tax=Hepatospora eriocheir TaxID=1081669 RepID=A0A1X0QJL3_9MICR|nr:hypothetical protein A0H76_2756 [Hepatospora eriocheir]
MLRVFIILLVRFYSAKSSANSSYLVTKPQLIKESNNLKNNTSNVFEEFRPGNGCYPTGMSRKNQKNTKSLMTQIKDGYPILIDFDDGKCGGEECYDMCKVFRLQFKDFFYYPNTSQEVKKLLTLENYKNLSKIKKFVVFWQGKAYFDLKSVESIFKPVKILKPKAEEYDDVSIFTS